MTDALVAAMWLLYAGWIGHLIGHSRGFKAARKMFAGAIEFERSAVEMAQGLKLTRQYVGCGPDITRSVVWKVRDSGEFDVTIKEREEN